MKIELHHAFVGMVIPATDWWQNLSPLRKAAYALVTTLAIGLSLGAGVGAWGAQAFDVPNRLSAVEVQIEGITAVRMDAIEFEIEGVRLEHRQNALYREENTCMLKRLMCRLDGDTANNCDLRFTVRAGKCPGG